LSDSQDDGAFAIAQALKSNEDVAVASLNLGSNFLTKFGQVTISASFAHFYLTFLCYFIFMDLTLLRIQSALTDARDHVFEMTEKEIAIFF
jgi:hypothetical protein